MSEINFNNILLRSTYLKYYHLHMLFVYKISEIFYIHFIHMKSLKPGVCPTLTADFKANVAPCLQEHLLRDACAGLCFAARATQAGKLSSSAHSQLESKLPSNLPRGTELLWVLLSEQHLT